MNAGPVPAGSGPAGSASASPAAGRGRTGGLHRAPFAPRGALRSGHVQTLVSSTPLRARYLATRAAALAPVSQPVVLAARDGARLEAHHARQPGDGPVPAVVLIHGWLGCATSSYVVANAASAYAAGYDVLRLNLRDHGATEHLNEDLFHSARTDEVIDAIADFATRLARGPLVVCGWSLGGNFALRAALYGEGRIAGLAGVCAVCPLLDPTESMTALDRGWVVYRQHFRRQWQQAMQRKQAAFPDRWDFGEAHAIRGVTALTDWFVDRCTPFTGYRDYVARYDLTDGRLAGLRVPGALLMAADDPVIPIAGLARLGRAPALAVWQARHGGHCGFVADPAQPAWDEGWLLARLAELAPTAARA